VDHRRLHATPSRSERWFRSPLLHLLFSLFSLTSLTSILPSPPPSFS
jgi:hypothetical protein